MFTYDTPHQKTVKPIAFSDSIQRKQSAANSLLNSVGKQASRRKSENNTGLPDILKARIENISGISLDDVKVHYNSSRPAQFRAFAYTQGTDIHVAPGQEKHLPHEAWHVIQQKQGRVKPTGLLRGVGINNDERLEHEADVMGEKLLLHAPLHVEASNAAKVQTTNAVQFLRTTVLRRNASVADRHNIPRPDTVDPLAIWAKTLMRERIAALFLTQTGLPGHATQVQQELSRLKNILENFSCESDDQAGFEYIEHASDFLEDIRSLIIKFAAEAAHIKHYTFNLHFDFPFGRVLSLQTNPQGHLLVNGKKYGDRSHN